MKKNGDDKKDEKEASDAPRWARDVDLDLTSGEMGKMLLECRKRVKEVAERLRDGSLE